MGRLLLILGILSILFACNDAKTKTYTINGTMPDSLSNGTMVYLSDYSTNSTIDSCKIVDAKFSFEGMVVDSLPILRIDASGDYRYYANVLNEHGVINVDMNRSSQVYGVPLNDTYAMFSFSIDSVTSLYSPRFKTLTSQSEIEALKIKLATAYDGVVKKYITGNEKNPLGVFIAWDVALGTGGEEQTLQLIDSLISDGGEIVKNFGPIKRIRQALVSKEKTAVGNMFVDFDAKNIDDSPAKLSNYVGNDKYVLVDFWASWCGPCKAEVPTIKEVYNNYKDKGLVVLGVNVWDSKENLKKSLIEEDMPWLHIYQAETSTPTEVYGINGIPHIILFAPDGTIAARGLRGDGMKAKMAEVFTDNKLKSITFDYFPRKRHTFHIFCACQRLCNSYH